MHQKLMAPILLFRARGEYCFSPPLDLGTLFVVLDHVRKPRPRKLRELTKYLVSHEVDLDKLEKGAARFFISRRHTEPAQHFGCRILAELVRQGVGRG